MIRKVVCHLQRGKKNKFRVEEQWLYISQCIFSPFLFLHDRMKLMLRPEWRLWPLSSFLGLLDLKTGVTVALLFAVFIQLHSCRFN